MDEQRKQWGVADSDDFWGGPTVAQRLEANRKAEQETFSAGWSRIYYAVAAAIALSTWVMLTFR